MSREACAGVGKAGVGVVAEVAEMDAASRQKYCQPCCAVEDEEVRVQCHADLLDGILEVNEALALELGGGCSIIKNGPDEDDAL
jgi:hypothetical protein